MPQIDWLPLDREVVAQRGDSSWRGRLSELADLDRLVLLGEPGAGKSGALAVAAQAAAAVRTTVREFIHSSDVLAGTTLYLDGLDEYRTDGHRGDKIHQLAQKLKANQVGRWRIGCRAEDWRGADLNALRQACDSAEIVVARLEPLGYTEAIKLLRHWGEAAPESFLQKADERGARALTRSPLSLRLLRTGLSESGGQWPTTRVELFDRATRALAHEHNTEHERERREVSMEAIVVAAEEASLLLLSTGGRSIWASAALPPATGDAREYLRVHEAALDQDAVRAALDTGLFRGDGNAFEPMHRVIAEFLAGRRLARLTRGETARPAFPLGRALALITGSEEQPPSDTRGLFGWLASHLAVQGDHEGVRRLIEIDPFTVLAYGDASVLDTAARRSILAGIADRDPFFRAEEGQRGERGDTSVGGLAHEDIAPELAAVLANRTERSHRLLTVLEALAVGMPVSSLRDVLRSIVLDPSREVWERRRALEALFNGESEPIAVARALFDTLHTENLSPAREELRIRLAARLYPASFEAGDIRDLLRDFRRLPDDRTIGRLGPLHEAFEAYLPEGLLDEPLTATDPNGGNSATAMVEVKHLISGVFRRMLATSKNIEEARIWRWLRSLSSTNWVSLDADDTSALTQWLACAPGRRHAFFLVIANDRQGMRGVGTARSQYVTLLREEPPATVVAELLDRYRQADSSSVAGDLLAVAVDVARFSADARAFWQVYDLLDGDDSRVELLQTLTTRELDVAEMHMRRQEKAYALETAEQVRTNVAALTPRLEALRAATDLNGLDWAVMTHYLRWESGHKTLGVEGLRRWTGDTIADAIMTGCEKLAIEGLDWTPSQLGRAEAKGLIEEGTLPALAGLDHLLVTMRSPHEATVALITAVVVLLHGHRIGGGPRGDALTRWAWRRLDADPETGATALLECWSAQVETGGANVAGISGPPADVGPHAALGRALQVWLAKPADVDTATLAVALQAAATHLNHDTLRGLVRSAIDDAGLVGDKRSVWLTIACDVDPATYGESFRQDRAADPEPAARYAWLTGSHSERDETSAAILLKTLVRAYAPNSIPEDNQSRGPRSGQAQRAIAALNELALRSDDAAGAALDELLIDAALSDWALQIRHAIAQRGKACRDAAFRFPTAAQVRGALDGKGPLNAGDLRAIVVEELTRIQQEMRTSDTSPWRRYWNIDQHCQPTGPRVENECRSTLLDRLRDRLQRYGIAVSMPEVQRGMETRVDVLVAAWNGGCLPIEVKRHMHPDVWTAAAEQLQAYAADPASQGHGAYVVFWFGKANDRRIPKRHDGSHAPATASDMQRLLVEDMSTDLRRKTSAFVFDVSPPRAESKVARPRPSRKAAGERPTGRERAALRPTSASRDVGSRRRN